MLDAFARTPDGFDRLLTDQAAPEFSGPGLVQARHAQHVDVRTILCPDSSQMVDEKEAATLAIDCIALKPLSLSDLVRLVRGVLDGSAAQRLSASEP